MSFFFFIFTHKDSYGLCMQKKKIKSQLWIFIMQWSVFHQKINLYPLKSNQSYSPQRYYVKMWVAHSDNSSPVYRFQINFTSWQLTFWGFLLIFSTCHFWAHGKIQRIVMQMASPNVIILWRRDFQGLESSESCNYEMRWHGSRFECDLLCWPYGVS